MEKNINDQWVTDKPPMDEDADGLGMVLVTNESGFVVRRNRASVKGEPWMPIPKPHRSIEKTEIGFDVETKDVYWSKPSDFPPICWLGWDHDGEVFCCKLVTGFSKMLGDWILETRDNINCGVNDMKHLRWSDKPFDKLEDGKKCLVER